MKMTAIKVVRLENVLFSPQDSEITSLRPQTIEDTNVRETSDSILSTGVFKDEGLQEEQEDASSKGSAIDDKVFCLPEDWPWIKQLSRPMSCMLTTSRLPCVKKAVSHLELIQNVIDDWFKNREDMVGSHFSKKESPTSASAQCGLKKQLRFVDPVSQCTTADSTITSVSKTSSRVSSPLTVMGIGAIKASEVEERETYNVAEDTSSDLDLPYLGADDAIDEVIILLARLEADRQETQQHYLEETRTVATLKKKIDDLCLRRLRDLPLLVQREHEACIMDLNELHWHVAYVTRTEAKSKNRKLTAAELHNSLKEEISFVKQHVPLVQEKLVLEVQAMDKIKKAQVETNQELMATQQRQAKTEQKSKEALTKAETERGHIKREIDTVRDKLKRITEEQTWSKMTFSEYTKQVSDISNQLEKNAQELQVLEVKDDSAKAAEEMQATKVRSLQGKIADAEFEFQQLENDNIQAAEELAVMKTKNSARIDELDRRNRILLGKLQTVQRRNQELTIDIEDTQEKISACEKQKVADEKNIVRINKEIERVDMLLQSITNEHIQVSAINNQVRDKLFSEQDKASRAEESLKTTVDSLRRQVKEEVHSRTVLQARIASDTLEIEKSKTESAKKREKAGKVSDDVDAAINNVLEKVEHLRSLKVIKKQKIAELESKLIETKSQHQESERRFQEQLDKLSPYQANLKVEVGELDKRLDHIAWKTTLMNNKTEEMDGAQTMMERVCKKTEAAIEELKEELAEASLQLETARTIGNNLKQQHQSVLDRLRDGENQHSRLIGDRKVALQNHEDEKNKCLARNRDLAARYRQLTNEFLIMKEQLLRDFDHRIKLETTITDIKQLKSLQSKLYGALADYFKLSGLYHEGELTRLESISADNSERVVQLQADMDEALHLITVFLSTQMDGARANQGVSEAVGSTKKAKSSGVGPRPAGPAGPAVLVT
ncbi:coiled-coil domain-containing protein 178-like [Pomacea canaliculata]|uniref:coiled-coil domain-containing protein 178-like n=1 Tax=Pomacea canaliculata TaxID=400727 RepID=UPI000D73C8CF|nr:coiled-coil domain-containing protein 178-like [Pomacea canaliculata]